VGFACQAIFLSFIGITWLSWRNLDRGSEALQKLFAFIHSSMLIRVIMILAVVATLMFGVLWMGGDRLAAKTDEQKSFAMSTDGTTRKEIWKATWQLIRHNPWTGVGFGAYFLAIAEYQDSSGRIKVEQAHNDYLDLAAGGGVIAVVLAALFIGVLIWRARSSLRSPDPYRRAAALGGIAGILSVGGHSFVDFGLQVTGIAVVFAALYVIVVADIEAQPVMSGSADTLRANRSRPPEAAERNAWS
jgi:O-antigen ligase